MFDPSGGPTPQVRTYVLREILLAHLERLEDLQRGSTLPPTKLTSDATMPLPTPARRAASNRRT
jgi:hypothetical protein